MDVKIACSPAQLQKLVSSPTFSSLHEFGTNVAAVEMHKKRVVFNKPYAVGFCFLELAKLQVRFGDRKLFSKPPTKFI